MCVNVPPPGRWNCSSTIDLVVFGLNSASRRSKNALAAPSARYRVKKPFGCVGLLHSSRFVTPSPSGSPLTSFGSSSNVTAHSGGSVLRYVNAPPSVNEPPAVVTFTSTVAGACAGVTAVIVVGVDHHHVGRRRLIEQDGRARLEVAAGDRHVRAARRRTFRRRDRRDRRIVIQIVHVGERVLRRGEAAIGVGQRHILRIGQRARRRDERHLRRRDEGRADGLAADGDAGAGQEVRAVHRDDITRLPRVRRHAQRDVDRRHADVGEAAGARAARRGDDARGPDRADREASPR